jgi:hypothetical protein
MSTCILERKKASKEGKTASLSSRMTFEMRLGLKSELPNYLHPQVKAIASAKGLRQNPA